MRISHKYGYNTYRNQKQRIDKDLKGILLAMPSWERQ